MKGFLVIIFLGSIGLFVLPEPNVTGNPAASGTVEGMVILAPKQTPVRFGGGSRYGRPSAKHSSSSQPSEDSVLIWLESSSALDSSPSGSSHILDQKDLKFMPVLLPVRQHDTVRILNSDPVYHNVFSLSSTKKFDVGRRPKGEYLDVTFDKPGLVNVFCDIHSNMHAVIYVMSPNVLTWTMAKNGDAFSLKDVPPGNYRLRVYALGYEEVAVPIEVTSGETTRISTLTLTS